MHMLSRYNKIRDIISQTRIPQLQELNISQEEIKRMLKDINCAIQSWKGVDLDSCKKKKTTFKQYMRTSTNWYNRNKAKFYGNYFFYPLIFKHLLNVCYINLQICHCSMLSRFTLILLLSLFPYSNTQKCKEIQVISESVRMKIFIEILINIFNSTIKFKKTKSQPLLPYQTVIQPNKFKDEIIGLIKYYGVEIDSNGINPIKVGKIYQKDSQRSKKISDSYKNALLTIQQLLRNNDQHPFYEISPYIGIRYNIQQANNCNTTFKPWLDYKSIEFVNKNKDENNAQFNVDQNRIKQERMNAGTNHNETQRRCANRNHCDIINAQSDPRESTIFDMKASTKTTQDNRSMTVTNNVKEQIQTNLCDTANMNMINNPQYILNNNTYYNIPNNSPCTVSYEQLLTNLVQNNGNNHHRNFSIQNTMNPVINNSSIIIISNGNQVFALNLQ